MADIRKVSYGIKKAFYALVDEVDGTTFGTPIDLIGITGFTMEASAEDTPEYADDQVHLVIPGLTSETGTLSLKQVPESFMTSCLGKEMNATGILTNTGVRKPFALTFLGTEYDAVGNETNVIFTMYNVLAGPQGITKTTVAGAKEGEVFELAVTLSTSPLALSDSGKESSYSEIYQSTTTQGYFDQHGTEIYLPDTPVPVTP